MLLAGADVAAMTSALLRNGPDHLRPLEVQVRDWMDRHGFETVDQLRGRLSQRSVPDPAAFERANYIKTLASHPGARPLIGPPSPEITGLSALPSPSRIDQSWAGGLRDRRDRRFGPARRRVTPARCAATNSAARRQARAGVLSLAKQEKPARPAFSPLAAPHRRRARARAKRRSQPRS